MKGLSGREGPRTCKVLCNVLMHHLGSRGTPTLNVLEILWVYVKRLIHWQLAQKAATSQNLVSKLTLATYFLNFDFYWKLFAASPESLHISTSMVKVRRSELEVCGCYQTRVSFSLPAWYQEWLFQQSGSFQTGATDISSEISITPLNCV